METDLPKAMPRQSGAVLTVIAAARYLTVSPPLLAIWRSRRVGPPWIQLSEGRVVYLERDLREWMENRRIVPERAYPRSGPGRLPKTHPQARTKANLLRAQHG